MIPALRLMANASGLSATTVTRLVTTWQKDYEGWSTRSLEGKQYVYIRADGVHFNIRLEENRQGILVMTRTAQGTLEAGRRELRRMNPAGQRTQR